MIDLSLEDIEFIKILATSDSTILQAGMNEATRKRLDERVGMILREYYRENTRNAGTTCTDQLLKFGIPIAVIIEIRATTTNNSKSVKPLMS